LHLGRTGMQSRHLPRKLRARSGGQSFARSRNGARRGSGCAAGFALAIESLMRKLRREPHIAEELFTGALREASLFDDLIRKVGGDRSVVERLIEYEREQRPNATRLTCLQNAISRWEQENR